MEEQTMDKRIAMAVAAGAVVALPLLGGCSASSAPQGASAAPAASSAASSAAAPSSAAVSTPSPSSDPTQDTAAVKAATETFIKDALTIGYPDSRFSDYTKRLKPLMTARGFTSVNEATTVDEGNKALKKLHGQHARTTPKIKTNQVTSATAEAAEVKISYLNLAQQKSGSDWKTLKTSAPETSTVKLVKDGGAWLVDDVS
jgi:hypothetical protein